MLNVQIEDGFGSGKKAKVNGEGELGVVIHTHPPLDESDAGLPFVEDFTNSAGATDMRVDGGTTNVDFSIEAEKDKDKFIKTVSVTIADAGAALNQFGSITALTNGVNFFWTNQQLGEVVIRANMKTNWDFVKLSRGNPAYGNTTAAFRASNVAGASEGYLFVLDMAQAFGVPWGIRLRKGTTDKLVFKIRDNVTTVDEFTAECTGMKF